MTSSNHTIRDISPLPGSGGNTTVIPYDVHLANLNEGTYVASIVVHIRQCSATDNSNGDSQVIQEGDYYNEDMEEFTIDVNTNDIEKDINVVKLDHTEGKLLLIIARLLS